MKAWVIAVSLFFMASCAGKTGPDFYKPRLRMAASEFSLGVSFNARLSGNIRPKSYKFYCPEQLWEFGDGVSHHHIYQCADYNPDDPWIQKRLFRKVYEYAEPGEYKVQLTLLKNGVPVAKSQDYIIEVN